MEQGAAEQDLGVRGRRGQRVDGVHPTEAVDEVEPGRPQIHRGLRENVPQLRRAQRGHSLDEQGGNGGHVGSGRRRTAERLEEEAELSRPVYYELAQIALSEGSDPPGIWSGGAFFRLDGSE